MDIPIPKKQTDNSESSESEPKESLAQLQKRLETGEEVNPRDIKEAAGRNLNQTRSILQNPVSQAGANPISRKEIAPIIDLHGENTIVRNSKIDSNFFMKQKKLSSSNVLHKGGRL